MDLSTASAKLESGMYGSRQEFVNDINLIVKNCHLYNNPNDIVYRSGDAFLAHFQNGKILSLSPLICSLGEDRSNPCFRWRRTANQPAINIAARQTRRSRTENRGQTAKAYCRQPLAACCTDGPSPCSTSPETLRIALRRTCTAPLVRTLTKA
jgi:hypothetical protein